MGTDIHLYVERRTANNAWERARPAPWICPWCRGSGKSPRDEDCFWCAGAGKTEKEFHERNYNLFAMLAGVRNGTGFAGCDTGDGFVPLAEPRGLPTDTSIEDTLNDDTIDFDSPNYVWLGDHSHSYCSLAEALGYDYDRVTKHRGCVNAAEYAAWLDEGGKRAPASFSGGVMDQLVRTIERSAMDAMLRAGRIDTTTATGAFGSPEADDGLCYYTTVEWEATYRESAGPSWFAFLEACLSLGRPEDVRLVFGFDS